MVGKRIAIIRDLNTNVWYWTKGTKRLEMLEYYILKKIVEVLAMTNRHLDGVAGISNNMRMTVAMAVQNEEEGGKHRHYLGDGLELVIIATDV